MDVIGLRPHTRITGHHPREAAMAARSMLSAAACVVLGVALLATPARAAGEPTLVVADTFTT